MTPQPELTVIDGFKGKSTAHNAELEIAGAALRGMLPRTDLDPGDIACYQARAVYEAALHLRDQGGMECITAMTIADELERRGQLAACRDIHGLDWLDQHACDQDTLEIAADAVRRAARERKAREALSRAAASDLDPDGVARARKALDDLASAESGTGGNGGTYLQPISEFIGQDEPDEDDSESWLVGGIIPSAAPFAIAGPPKAEKTWSLIDLAICQAAGINWLNTFQTKNGRCLLMLREDSVREVRRRLWRLCRGHGIDPRSLDGQLVVSVVEPFYLDAARDVERMRRTLDQYRPAMVGLDSLSRMHRADENDKAAMNVVTTTWSDLCCEYGVSIGCIHHFSKGGGQQGGDKRGPGLRMRGSSDLFALVRHVVGIDPIGGHKGTSRVETEGNLPGQPEPFAISLEDGLDAFGKAMVRIVHRGDAADLGAAEVDAKALQALQAGPLKARDLRAAVGCKTEILGRRCFELERKGLICRDDDRSPWRLAVRS